MRHNILIKPLITAVLLILAVPLVASAQIYNRDRYNDQYNRGQSNDQYDRTDPREVRAAINR
ncbi:MAG TPA: hypothetical protein VK582_10600, partial [Pyrinomonadaceae bacterium]|nr:hypothetical protein [Pyrinomonadaceae bacterium]